MPETPEGWRSTTLGASGNLGARRPRPFKGRRPYVATADLVGGQVRPSEIVSFADRPARADLELRSGDVLQAKMKATDKALLVATELDGWLASTGFAQFSPQAVGNDPAFFFHWVSSARFHYLKDALCVGSTQQAISDRELSAIRLALPPPEEQARIAEILDTIDEAIRRTEQVIAKLQQMKQGLLHDLLTRGIDDNGKLRNIGDHSLFVESSQGPIPRGWRIERLERLTTQIVDGVHHTPDYVESGVPFLTVENLTRGPGISFSPTRFVSERAHREYSKRVLPIPGDVLVSKDGTLGVARIVPGGSGQFSIFVSIALLRPRRELVLTEWIRLFFESPWYEVQLGKQSAGTGLKHIHLEHFRGFELRVPPLVEQSRIVNVIGESEDRLRVETATLTKLRNLKQGLSGDLLSGRARVRALEGVSA